MMPEKQGYLTWGMKLYLHRHVYFREFDDVVKKLCKEKNAKKSRGEDDSILYRAGRGALNNTTYRWAKPTKLAI